VAADRALPRVVSLIASSTEIVCALGCEEALVGRSHECDWPRSVLRLPAVSRPAFLTSGSSRAVDLALKERLARALSVYEVDADLLKRLAPDLIVTQTQCDVCAVSPADVERGAELVRRLQWRVADIERRVAALQARPRVAVIEWIEPLMAAGNWMPELVALAGGVNLFGEARKHSPWMTWEALVAADPDVIVVSPCGFDVPRTRSEIASLVARPGWAALRAVRSGRVYLADGNAYFHRPGPRLVESLEILAEVLHPLAFDFGHTGRGWVAFAS
jgi:iron complex transport system substrate-binding protein